MNETESRKKWKDEWAQSHYSTSYDALCSDRKRIVDQMYVVTQMIEDDKKNPKGCR